MKIWWLGREKHADSKYPNQFAVRATLDYKPLRGGSGHSYFVFFPIIWDLATFIFHFPCCFKSWSLILNFVSWQNILPGNLQFIFCTNMFFFMSRDTPADFSFNHSSKTGPGRQNRSQVFVERALHQPCDLKDWLRFTVLLGKYLPLLPIVTFLQMCKPKTEQTSVVPCNNYFNYLFFIFTWVLTDLASFCWDLCRCNLCTCSLLANLTHLVIE